MWGVESRYYVVRGVRCHSCAVGGTVCLCVQQQEEKDLPSAVSSFEFRKGFDYFNFEIIVIADFDSSWYTTRNS